MEEKRESSSPAGFDLGIDEHQLSVEELCTRYQTDPEQGLSEAVVQEHRHKYGQNKTSPPIPRSIFYRLVKHILHGVSSLMVSGAIVCLIAFFADLIGNLDSHVDMENLFLGVALSIFITITGIISFVRQRMATSVLRQSGSMVRRQAKVVRGGKKTRLVDTTELVVGDLVELKYGDEVPADIRVIHSIGFKVDSAPLTGISEPKPVKVECTHANPLVTSNLLYSSTYALEGFCRGIVIRVGDRTLIGRITGITSQLKVKQTPLSKDVTLMVLTFTTVGLVFAMICWIGAMRLDYSWSSATVFFVGVCVAIVPESLLAAITVCHSVAGQRMIKKGCIAKQFDAIENLGSTSIICVDKTGTLTQNKLRVSCVWAGKFLTVIDDQIQEMDVDNSKIQDLLRCIVLTSKATAVTVEKEGILETEVKDGAPTDVSLLRFSTTAYAGGIELRMRSAKVHEVPFNYRTFYQMFIHLEHTGHKTRCRIVVRGAPERIFRMCSTIFVEGKEDVITEEIKHEVETALNTLGNKEERVVGFCDKVIGYSPDMVFDESSKNYPVTGYRFLGLVSLSDPPRPGASEFISKLRSAAIKVVMLTGDHPATATAIANTIGLISNDADKTASIFTDADLKDLIQTKRLGEVLKETEELVFARVSPEQKAIIVESFQRQGELVTMIGDGINDCAAMRAADTSVSLGALSSEATKQIADIVILDNSLASVISGIEEGRLVFENMKKCFAFTIATNIPTILPFVLFLFLGMPLPVNPMSVILLAIGVNLLPGIALAYEPPEWDLMQYSVRAVKLKNHKLFSARLMERSYARIGIAEALAGLFGYTMVMVDNGFHIKQLLFLSQRWYSRRVVSDSHGQEWTYDQRQHLEDVAQTVYFYNVALVQFAHLLGCKNRHKSLFRHAFKNWRLIMAIMIPLILITVIVKTQVLHVIETSRIEAVPSSLLLPALPFAIFIFIYDEFRRFIIRKFPDGWFGQHLDF